MNEKNIKNFLYVCPNCLNELKKCECYCYPDTLIQIDKNIYPIIKELNKRHYITESCCEGHIGSNEFMYISFKKKYKFKTPLPNGIDGKESHIKADIKGSSEQAKKRKKRELLNKLYKWVCDLEER